ncbi:hypothetical protein ACFSTC_24345 [Nonomuraea ferruginea]
MIGDTLLDVDVDGEAVRLCPDAPVPVVDVTAEHARPGGAGLAALLAARDGADVVLITAIGDDPAGRRLCGLLSAELELVRLPLRGETVRKTRVRAGGQTLLRLDTGDGTAPPFPAAPTTGPAHQDEVPPREAPETRDAHPDPFDHHALPTEDHTQDTDSHTIAAGEYPQHANVTTSDPHKPEPNPTAANGNARDADVTAAGGNTTTDPHTPEPDQILAKGNARDADVIVTGGNTTADRHTREGGPTATNRSVRDTELTAASGSASAANPHTPESDPTAAKANTRDKDVTAAGGSVSGAERHMGGVRAGCRCPGRDGRGRGYGRRRGDIWPLGMGMRGRLRWLPQRGRCWWRITDGGWRRWRASCCAAVRRLWCGIRTREASGRPGDAR